MKQFILASFLAVGVAGLLPLEDGNGEVGQVHLVAPVLVAPPRLGCRHVVVAFSVHIPVTNPTRLPTEPETARLRKGSCPFCVGWFSGFW